MTFLPRIAALVAVALVLPSASAAQYVGSSSPRRGAVEIAASALWNAPQELSGPAATLTPNPATGSPSFQLFASDPTLQAALGGQATVGFYITSRLAIEGGARFSRPELRVRLSDDFEGAESVSATSALSQYLFTGSLVYHFGGERISPFIAAGGGHVRDVHEGNELVETGTEYHGKAGIKMWIGQRQKLGLRLEAGVSFIDGGFSFEDSGRTAPSAAIGLAYRF